MKINFGPTTVIRSKTTAPVDAQGNVVGSPAAKNDPKPKVAKLMKTALPKASKVARYNLAQTPAKKAVAPKPSIAKAQVGRYQYTAAAPKSFPQTNYQMP